MSDTTTQIKQWGKSDLPVDKFKGMKALVLGGAFFGSVVSFIAAAGFEKADSVEEADIVVFSGGVDVDPELYGQKKIAYTQSPSKSRDATEVEVYKEAQRLGKVCFGICRGAQFLAAMNGSQLWQHVTGHASGDHWMYDIEEDVHVMVTSYHHQMIALDEKIDVIGVCKDQISKEFHSDSMVLKLANESDVEIEIEAGAYNDTKCFFVQGHPEVGDREYRSWTMHKLADKMEEWADEVPGESDGSVEENMQKWEQARMVNLM